MKLFWIFIVAFLLTLGLKRWLKSETPSEAPAVQETKQAEQAKETPAVSETLPAVSPAVPDPTLPAEGETAATESVPAALEQETAAAPTPPATTPKKATEPQPGNLNDLDAVQAFLSKKTMPQPNTWKEQPVFQDKQKFKDFLQGIYKGPLIGLDKTDLKKELTVGFDELSMNEATAAISGTMKLTLYNHLASRTERESAASGEGVQMIRQSGVDDSITISWRGGHPSDELLQIFFPTDPSNRNKLFGIYFKKTEAGLNQPLKPLATFVLTRVGS